MLADPTFARLQLYLVRFPVSAIVAPSISVAHPRTLCSFQFFEAYPLVFGEAGVYGWNLGVSTLPFAGFVVTSALSYGLYVLYLKTRIASLYASGRFTPEDRLEIAVISASMIPPLLLAFGWSARTK